VQEIGRRPHTHIRNIRIYTYIPPPACTLYLVCPAGLLISKSDGARLHPLFRPRPPHFSARYCRPCLINIHPTPASIPARGLFVNFHPCAVRSNIHDYGRRNSTTSAARVPSLSARLCVCVLLALVCMYVVGAFMSIELDQRVTPWG
jgi:hypothetical protein